MCEKVIRGLKLKVGNNLRLFSLHSAVGTEKQHENPSQLTRCIFEQVTFRIHCHSIIALPN
jgi:hypothetical protein